MKEKVGFGEIFKTYGESLDSVIGSQKELSVWKEETDSLIKPLKDVDVVNIDKNLGILIEEKAKTYKLLKKMKEELIKTRNIVGDINDKLITVERDNTILKDENKALKQSVSHLEHLTDIISFTRSSECAELKRIAKKKVLTMLGGSVTDERYKLFYKKYIMNLYGYVKKELKVSSIDKIPTSKLEEANKLVGKWIPTPSFKSKLISDLVEETKPNKSGAFKVKVETVAQFNSLMERFNGEPHKYM